MPAAYLSSGASALQSFYRFWGRLNAWAIDPASSPHPHTHHSSFSTVFGPHLENEAVVWDQRSQIQMPGGLRPDRNKNVSRGPGIHRRQTGELRPHSKEAADTQLQSNLPCGIVGPVLIDLLFQRNGEYGYLWEISWFLSAKLLIQFF